MILFLLLNTASAYDLNGWDWSHHNAPVEEDFSLNVASFPSKWGTKDEIESAYTLGLWVWNVEGEAGIYLPYGGRTQNTQYGNGDNGQNVTMYGGKDWGYALAAAIYNASSGQMTDCDIEFYNSNFNGTIDWSFEENGAASGEMDFTHTVIHEVGHCIGFSHSNNENAIMYSYNTSGTGWERRHLKKDDKNGLQAMYGATAVDLRVDEIVITEEEADDVGRPGEVIDVEVRLSNEGDGRSVDIVGVISADDESRIAWVQEAAELGDLPGGSNVGTLNESLYFSFEVDSECEGSGETFLRILADDAAENGIDKTQGFTIDCSRPGENDGSSDPTREGAAAGCGCATGGPSVGWLGLLGLAFLRRRTASNG